MLEDGVVIRKKTNENIYVNTNYTLYCLAFKRMCFFTVKQIEFRLIPNLP